MAKSNPVIYHYRCASGHFISSVAPLTHCPIIVEPSLAKITQAGRKLRLEGADPEVVAILTGEALELEKTLAKPRCNQFLTLARRKDFIPKQAFEKYARKVQNQRAKGKKK